MAQKCLRCGNRKVVTRFEGETFTIEHFDMITTVAGLSGWRCRECGDVEFDAHSARHYAAAGDALVLRERENSSPKGAV